MTDFKAKMYQIRFRLGRRGSAPDPAVGAYSAPPDPLAEFRGPTSKGGEGRGPPICVWHRAPRELNPALCKRKANKPERIS